MDFQSTNLIAFLYKWRKPLLVLPLLAGVTAAIFSSPIFITPKYQSSVILYPSTTNSVSKALLPQTGYADQDILEFGAEDEAEQLLQILNSDEIRDTVVSRFNLMEHYDIDQESPYKMTELRETFSDNVEFRRTEFMSVEISVLDEDPQTAADIANYISGLLDRVKTRIQRDRARIGLEIVQDAYNQIKGESKALENGLKELRLHGVHDYESQAAVYSEQLAIAIVERGPNDSRVKELKNQMDTLAKYGGRYVDIRDELELLKEEEVKVKIKLDQAKVDYHQNLPSTFKVNSAIPAEKKTYPIRSLIVLISMMGTFVATMIVILSLSAYNDIRKAQK